MTIHLSSIKFKNVKAMTFKLGVLAVFVVLTAPVHAQTNPATLGESGNLSHFRTSATLRPPAVEEVNAKIGYAGGNMNSSEGHNFDGSVTFPVSRQFGFQADALYSRIANQDFYGGAGHLFWRNPDIGLVGLAGGYLGRSGVDTFQVGAEGEYYLGSFTFGLFAGVGSISYANAAPFIDTNPTRFVGQISADYYVLDELRLGVSYTTAFHNNLVKGEAEYQTPIRGLALTAEVTAGDHGYDDWLLGVRYYFGSNKSLRDRHRRDDPRSLMPQILQGLGVYGAEFNRKGKAYLAAHLGAGSLEGGGSYGVVLERVIGREENPLYPPMPPVPID
ncbi:MAG: hypothetical protein MUF81_14920 [Verrucomicrobia bacterium]|jgi:hypothetical protein|nr:hypothetical protein [Verrucomicrobiota bacterium]